MSKKKKTSFATTSDVIARLKEIESAHGVLPVRVNLPGLPRKPVLAGIRYFSGDKTSTADIVPHYDIKGSVNEASGCNTIAGTLADVQSFFKRFCEGVIAVKGILENYKTTGKTTVYNGRNVQIVPMVRGEFKNLFEIAKEVQAGIKSLQGFDKRLMQVVSEPIKDADYTVAYSHHIDISLSDAEFAKAITDGIGEKTSVQRLAVFVDILRKINKEIQARKGRIAQLENRIKREGNSNEGLAAKMLKTKSLSLIKTLESRRKYVMERFNALKASVLENVSSLTDEAEGLLAK